MRKSSQIQRLSKRFGSIPKSWNVVPIGDLFKERQETSNDTARYPLYSLTIESGIVSKTERYDRTFLLRNKEENKYKLAYPGDFVFNPMNLRFGAIAYSKYKFTVAVSAYYNVLKPVQDKFDARYLIELLKSYQMVDLYDVVAAGSLVEKRRVHWSALCKLLIPLPPLSMQKKIGVIVDTWDKAIALTEQLVAAKQKRKKALMQQLLTGQRRFREYNGDLWHKAKLKQLLNIQYGKSPKVIMNDNGRYLVYGTGGVVGRTNQTLCDEAAIVIGRKGTINQPQLVLEPFWAIDTAFYGVPNEDVDVRWLYYVLSCIDLGRYNEASGVPSLSRNTLYNIDILVPGVEEQKRIAAVLQSCDAEITLLTQKLAALQRQKKGLMQQLLTGWVRVSPSASPPLGGRQRGRD